MKYLGPISVWNHLSRNTDYHFVTKTLVRKHIFKIMFFIQAFAYDKDSVHPFNCRLFHENGLIYGFVSHEYICALQELYLSWNISIGIDVLHQILFTHVEIFYYCDDLYNSNKSYLLPGVYLLGTTVERNLWIYQIHQGLLITFLYILFVLFANQSLISVLLYPAVCNTTYIWLCYKEDIICDRLCTLLCYPNGHH